MSIAVVFQRNDPNFRASKKMSLTTVQRHYWAVDTLISIEGDGENTWAGMDPHAWGELGEIKLSAVES